VILHHKGHRKTNQRWTGLLSGGFILAVIFV